VSYHRQRLWQTLQCLPGVAQAFQLQGVAMPDYLPDADDIRAALLRTADVETVVSPWPWKILMTRLRPVTQRVEEPVLVEAR